MVRLRLGHLLKERHSSLLFAEFMSALLRKHQPSAPISSGPCDQVLVESGTWMYPNNIALAIFMAEWRSRRNLEFVSYSMPPKDSRLRIVRYLIDLLAGRKRVLHTIGISRSLRLRPSSEDKVNARRLAFQIFGSDVTKESFAEIEVYGIQIGDLLFDDYIGVSGNPCPDIAAPSFHAHAVWFLELFFFFLRTFRETRIVGVLVSHGVYRLGLVARIAAVLGLEAYQVNLNSVHRITPEQPLAYMDFAQYPEVFQSMSHHEQSLARQQAVTSALSILQFNDQLPRIDDSLYGRDENTSRLALVAVHNLLDNPHAYGTPLFPDYVEWLRFISQFSGKSGYKWMIKCHPHSRARDEEYLRRQSWFPSDFQFVEGNPRVRDLVTEGVSVVFTQHGTVTAEYPWFGVPVVTASRRNPQFRYGFACHPQSKTHLAAIILNLDVFVGQWKIDLREVSEFWFMHYEACESSWVIPDYRNFIESLGGEGPLFSHESYDAWRQIANTHILGHSLLRARHILSHSTDRIPLERFTSFELSLHPDRARGFGDEKRKT